MQFAFFKRATYLKIIRGSQKDAKMVKSSYVPFAQLLPMITSYTIRVHYENQKIDNDMHIIVILSPVDLCNHQCNLPLINLNHEKFMYLYIFMLAHLCLRNMTNEGGVIAIWRST